MTATWAILIASVYTRHDQLCSLLDSLAPQLEPWHGQAQVLIDRDDCDLSIGEKRTRLLHAADADYVSFVDDDDRVADDYVARIMHALHTCPEHGETQRSEGWYGIKYECPTCLAEGRAPNGATVGPDYVGFRLALTVDGRPEQRPVIHSLRYDKWWNDGDGIYRGVSHLNPLRRELALLGLPFLPGFGEDGDWARRVQATGQVKTEVFLDGDPCYFYDWSSAGSLFNGGPKRVGHAPELPAHDARIVRVLRHDGSVADN